MKNSKGLKRKKGRLKKRPALHVQPSLLNNITYREVLFGETVPLKGQ
jgi:hypothetical protein